MPEGRGAADASRRASASRGWGRHFEGWPLALSIVLTVALSAALVVPRGVQPDAVPAPQIDRIEQAARVEEEAERAARAAGGLSFEVRSVGEAYRSWGRAAFAHEDVVPQLEAQLRRLAKVVIDAHGEEALLDLRALQAQLFVRSLTLRSDVEPTLDRRELGGDFLALGLEHGWFGSSPSAADARELGTLFRVHWADVLGLGHRHPFAPTLNEWRVYYRFLLAQPTSTGAEHEGDVRRKLGYVAALAEHDRDYPFHLARGVLLYQRGDPLGAAAELRTHLSQHPDGPWTLRARNYLAACGAALVE